MLDLPTPRDSGIAPSTMTPSDGHAPRTDTKGQGPLRARTVMAGYLAALGAIGVSLLFHYALGSWSGSRVPYLEFYPAITIVASYGGLGPGIFTTAASALLAGYLSPPLDPSDSFSLVVFVATGVAVAWLYHRLRRAEASQRAAAATATARAERLDAILDTTVDGIIVIDRRGTIEAFNRGAERLFGYAESEAIGKNVNLLMPSPHHEEHDRYLERYLTTGEARIIGIGRAVIGRRKDGTTFPLHLAVGEMLIGGERKFTGMLHDLTPRAALHEQLQASEARWRAVIDSAVDGIIVIDAHGLIESFNPGAQRLFGHTESDVVGRNVSMLMPSPFHEEHDGYLARYLETGHEKIIGIGREAQGLRKDGTTFPLHLSVGELTVQGERKFTGILHDLTARVRLEEQLREQNALVKLGEMAAVIAHEVKNPLAGIRGAIQVVGSRLPQDHASLPVLKEIVARIDSLDQMMKDLLLFARTPKPRRKPTEVMPLVAATASLLRQDPALRDIEIDMRGSSPAIEADPDMLTIAFQNLLINGAHAMQGKGRIGITVRSDAANCEVAFIDSGPGIAPEIRQKIFVPFFTTKSRGSGLGLPTAKRLIEAHGGQIALDCPPTGGTTVVVRLPLSP